MTNQNDAVLRVSLVAPSGSGKSSTALFMLERCAVLGLSARIVKLAGPLYHIQQQFYRVAGVDIDPFAQNQKLLEDIATHLRSIRRDAIAHDFLNRLATEPADVVINDDLRDMETDLPALRKAGFVTVRVSASAEVIDRRLDTRRDLQTQRASALDAPMLAHRPDHVVVNDGDDLEAYRKKVYAFLDLMLARYRGRDPGSACSDHRSVPARPFEEQGL
jgi:cytidine deaminase